MSRALVFKWYCRFADGQNTLEEQEGRAGKKQYDAVLVMSIREALVADRRLTIEET